MIAIISAALLQASAAPHYYGFEHDMNFGTTCTSRTASDISWCNGYTEAAALAMMTFGRICPSRDVTGIQVVAVVQRFLNQHPELWDRGAMWLIDRALTEAFPCRILGPQPR